MSKSSMKMVVRTLKLDGRKFRTFRHLGVDWKGRVTFFYTVEVCQ